MNSSESEKGYVPGGEDTYLWMSRCAIALVTVYLRSPYAYRYSYVLKITALLSEHMYFSWDISY